MQYLDLTLPEPTENVAFDEALLDSAEAGEGPSEIVRLWEAPRPMVVVGRSSRLAREVRLGACRSKGIPVLRRSSGGAAIVAAPGCLMYAVVLSYERHPQLRALDQAHAFVLDRLASSLGTQLARVARAGTSDLVLTDGPSTDVSSDTRALKFSGNALRCKRTHLLYHGTLLYDFPLELMEEFLLPPPRQPYYRAEREHGRFVTNLSLDRDALCQTVLSAFDAREQTNEWPRARVAQLVEERYSQPEWNECFV